MEMLDRLIYKFFESIDNLFISLGHIFERRKKREKINNRRTKS
jgi:hypothetical protein